MGITTGASAVMANEDLLDITDIAAPDLELVAFPRLERIPEALHESHAANLTLVAVNFQKDVGIRAGLFFIGSIYVYNVLLEFCER